MLGQDGSPCPSAALQWWPHGVRSRSLGYLLFVPGWRLGLLEEGKTAKANTVEAWTSYRGEDCEKNQGEDCDIKQGIELGKESGQRLGHFTGGKAVRNTRVSRQSW